MSNSRLILWTIIISLSLIIGLSYYKISKESHDATYKVITKKITESASRCVNDDKCSTNMTYGELISKGYLEKMVDPDTKMYYSDSSTIKLEEGKYIFTPSY